MATTQNEETLMDVIGEFFFRTGRGIVTPSSDSFSSSSRMLARYSVLGGVLLGWGVTTLATRTFLNHHVKDIQKRMTDASNAPQYCVDNENIKNHYRPQLSPNECVVSSVTAHNETFNIVSHGAASVFYLVVIIRRIIRYYRTGKGLSYNPPENQSLLLLLQPLSYVFTFGISSLAHMFGSHSQDTNTFLFQIDRGTIALPTGITVLLSALLAFPEPGWKRIVSSLLIIGSTAACILNVAIPRNRSRSTLTGSFILLGLTAIWPIISQIILLHQKREYRFMGKFLFYFFAAVLPILSAAMTYAHQFPEKYLSSKDYPAFAQTLIDLWGLNGHGVMHVLSVLHSWVAYRGLKMWNRERKLFL